jgi:hypothetical protein
MQYLLYPPQACCLYPSCANSASLIPQAVPIRNYKGYLDNLVKFVARSEVETGGIENSKCFLFTFARPIFPYREKRFSSCVSASAFLFHEWRECYPLQASRFPGSPEGDRLVRVRFRQGRRRVSMPWRICRGSGETQRKQVDIPFPSRYLPHANAPNADAGHSCQCSFSSLSCLRARLTA